MRLVCRGVDDRPGMHGIVRDIAFRGSAFTYRVEVPGLPELVKAEMPGEGSAPVNIGSEVSVLWDVDACRLLSQESGS
jgi:hypothetical protein